MGYAVAGKEVSPWKAWKPPVMRILL